MTAPQTSPARGRATGRGLASLAAALLAFAASQHHNLHMVIIALGAGSAGSTLMQGYPMVRRAMLLVSIGVVALNLRSLRRRPPSPGMRWWILGVSALTLALVIWSTARFGL
ncbi:MAG: hypothetical protein QN178_04560 [Armatimonadota bacterium]|nr:hypothetical protein [Armatimonadota bacterium]